MLVFKGTDPKQTYSKLTAAGVTIYRKSGSHDVFVVLPGESHSEAWAAVKS